MIRFFITLFSFLLVEEIFSSSIASLYFKLVCVENVSCFNSSIKEMSCNFKKCDPYFEICISHKPIEDPIDKANCIISYKTTKQYNIRNFDCNAPINSRQVFNEEISKEFQNYSKVFMRVEVKYEPKSIIAKFHSEYSPERYSLLGNYDTKSVSRISLPKCNPEARLIYGMGLYCKRDTSPKDCSQICHSYFNCLTENQKNCPKCSLSANPCYKIQCLNNGSCNSKKHDKQFYCNCPNGFSGDRCEITNKGNNLQWILVIIVLVLIICLLVFLICYLRYRSTSILKSGQNSSMKDNDLKDTRVFLELTDIMKHPVKPADVSPLTDEDMSKEIDDGYLIPCKNFDANSVSLPTRELKRPSRIQIYFTKIREHKSDA